MAGPSRREASIQIARTCGLVATRARINEKERQNETINPLALCCAVCGFVRSFGIGRRCRKPARAPIPRLFSSARIGPNLTTYRLIKRMHRRPVPPLAARPHSQGRGAMSPSRPAHHHHTVLIYCCISLAVSTTKTKNHPHRHHTPNHHLRGNQSNPEPPLYLLALVKYNPSAMATSITMTAKGLSPPLEGSSDAREIFSLASFSTSSAWMVVFVFVLVWVRGIAGWVEDGSSRPKTPTRLNTRIVDNPHKPTPDPRLTPG